MKRALVTGAAAGLGRALVQQLLAKGWSVTALDRDEEGLLALHLGMNALVADFVVPGIVERLCNDLAAGEGFDLVIHNAGISATGHFEKIEPEAHLRLLQVNLRAPVRITNTLLANGKINKGGSLLFVSSLSQAVGYPGAASYAASKDAIASYGASLRKRLKADGVSVSVAFPGPLRTDHAARHAPDGADASKRMTPEDAAVAILKGAIKGKARITPGFAASAAFVAGNIAPGPMAAMMRRVIYDKLDKSVAD